MQLRAPAVTAAWRHPALVCILAFAQLGVRPDAWAQGPDSAAEAARPPVAGHVSTTADVVVRRDGTSVAGVILDEHTGEWIIVLGANGPVTIPWDDIDHVVRSASPTRAPSSPASAPSSERSPPEAVAMTADPNSDFRAASKRIAGVSLGADLRADANMLLKHYTLRDGSSYGSYGAGVGAVAAVALHFRGPPAVDEDRHADWFECELGVGAGGHGGFWKPQTVASAAILEAEIPFVMGVRYAIGHLRPTRMGVAWSGLLLGLAWAPTYVYFFDQRGVPPGGAFNPTGIRLTVDIGQMALERRTLTPVLRFVVGWLPNVGPLPTVIDAGIGCAFY